MTAPANPSGIYTDTGALKLLKSQARKDGAAALAQTAEQFESLFIHMMLKSMRNTTMGGGFMDSEHSRFYQEMFDQQIAVDLAKKRQVGIADMLIQQLGGPQAAGQDAPTADAKLGLDRLRLQRPVTPVAIEAFAPAQGVSQEPIKDFESPEDFVEKLWPLAEKYATELGVEPKVLLAQAALETGWGQHMTRYSNGVPTNNLFNIKADSRWEGPRAVVSTLEYERGTPVRQLAAFRSYPSFEASFKDYVAFLKSSERYQGALEKAADGSAFVQALHQAGYATDPGYSFKINRILDGEVFDQVGQKFKGSLPQPLT